MKDRTRITSLQQAGNESENSDNAEHDGTPELCSGQESEEHEEVVGVAQVTLPQQERLTRKRKKKQENNNSASATLMKYLIENKKEERVPDPIDTFFSLMANTVKKFSSADQHFIKTKVFSLVSDIEGKYIHAQAYATQSHNVCPLPSPSPALSQYSSSSSTSAQPIQQLQETPQYQEHIHGTPSPMQPASTSQWHNQQHLSAFPS